MLLEDGPAPYLDTLARFKSTLDVKTIVPGHGPLATVETVPQPRGHGFPPWHPAARMNWLVKDLHRLNVLATYRDLERQPTAA